MTYKSRKNLEILCAGFSLLRAEGFFCSVFDPKPWIRIGIQPKMLDPDPDPCQMNTDPKQWSRQTLADPDLIITLKIVVSDPHWFQC